MATPLTWIEAPARSPRPNTSLDVLPVHDVSNEHFIGYQYMADPCGFPNPLPQDCYITIGLEPAGSPKRFGDTGNEVVTEVFGAYQGIECFLNGGLPEFRSIAQRVLENGEHRVVDGVIGGMLVTQADPTTPGTAASIATAVGILEQFLAADVPGLGYIYMSPLNATIAAGAHLLVQGLDGSLTTYLGTPVVVLTESNLGAFIYASGPVNIWRGEIVVSDAPGWTTNMGRALAERLYSLSIECGIWKVGYTPPASDDGNPPEDPESLTLAIGTIPSSPVPAGTDVTVNVQANVIPTDEVHLFYRINAGAWVDKGEMAQVTPTEFVDESDGALAVSGDVVDLYAESGTTVSPTITIEVS